MLHRWMMGSEDVLKKSLAPLRTHSNLLIVVTQIFPMLGTVFGHYVASITWLATRRAMNNHRNILSKNIIENVEAGQKMSLSDVSKAETQWRKIYRDFEVFFEDIDLLIVPGNATTALQN